MSRDLRVYNYGGLASSGFRNARTPADEGEDVENLSEEDEVEDGCDEDTEDEGEGKDVFW